MDSLLNSKYKALQRAGSSFRERMSLALFLQPPLPVPETENGEGMGRMTCPVLTVEIRLSPGSATALQQQISPLSTKLRSHCVSTALDVFSNMKATKGGVIE